jgi:hypothetical protein
MFLQAKRVLKELIVGSRFEPVAKRVHAALFGGNGASHQAESSSLASLNSTYDD